MNYEVIEALGQIAREKNVDKSLVIETLAAGLVAAVRRKHGQSCEVDVVVDEANHRISIFLLKNIVDDVEDPALEASLQEAQEFDPEYDVGHVLRIELPVDEFGRNAIQAVKQVVVQRVREAERTGEWSSARIAAALVTEADLPREVAEQIAGRVEQRVIEGLRRSAG